MMSYVVFSTLGNGIAERTFAAQLPNVTYCQSAELCSFDFDILWTKSLTTTVTESSPTLWPNYWLHPPTDD